MRIGEYKNDDLRGLGKPMAKRTEREKLREMNSKEKLSYLWEYYKVHAFGVILLLAGIFYIIYSILTPKVENKLHAVLVNNTASQESLDVLHEDLSQRFDLKEPYETIFLDARYFFYEENEFSVGLEKALAVYLLSGDLDIMIAPESDFLEYSEQGVFCDLSNSLPTDIYSNLTDAFYFTTTMDDNIEKLYGLYLGDTEFFSDMNEPDNPLLLGVFINAPNRENSLDTIRYFFTK